MKTFEDGPKVPGEWTEAYKTFRLNVIDHDLSVTPWYKRTQRRALKQFRRECVTAWDSNGPN